MPNFEDPNGDHELEVGPAKVKGTVMQVDRRGFRFDGSRLHATMPWKGRRDVVVAYLAKDVGKLSEVDKAFLIDLGFPLDPATCVGPTPRIRSKPLLGFTARQTSLSRKQCESGIRPCLSL